MQMIGVITGGTETRVAVSVPESTDPELGVDRAKA